MEHHHMSNQTKPVLWALGGIAMGALTAYLMDPERGKTRRALIRDQVTHGLNKTRKVVQAKSQDLSNRAEGVMHEAQSMVRPSPDQE